MRGVFFGLEYDNDAIPNAIVIAGTRSGKFVKWVQEYLPTTITRADGSKVLRERRVIQLPMHYNLRKDEIYGAMKRNKTESYQDGKFFVLEAHAIGVHIHPVKAKIEKEAKEKLDAQLSIADKKPGQPGPTIKPVTVEQAKDALTA
jgi:hypothetical protein